MFGSEFLAMKTAEEQIMALYYKLRMLGLPIEGPANVFCDNEAVVTNSSTPTSTIKKKHLSICYHLVRSYYEAEGMRVTKENGKNEPFGYTYEINPWIAEEKTSWNVSLYIG
jgi:hypothetical protein